jgi:hypothetical protein
VGARIMGMNQIRLLRVAPYVSQIRGIDVRTGLLGGLK